MNSLTIIGNLTKDGELRTTQTGKQVYSFTVVVNRRQKREGQPDADFFNVTAWDRMAENCSKYLAKGRKVAVTGSVSARAYQRQDGMPGASMEVQARDVEFLSPKAEPQEQQNDFMQVIPDDLPWGNK